MIPVLSKPPVVTQDLPESSIQAGGVLDLPSELLENVLQFVTVKELNDIHLVCKAWCQIPFVNGFLDLSTIKNMTDDKLSSLLKVINLKEYKISRINLSGSQITDAGLATLAKNFPKLTDLNLENCEKITNGGVRFFQQSKPFVAVKYTLKAITRFTFTRAPEVIDLTHIVVGGFSPSGVPHIVAGDYSRSGQFPDPID